MAGRFHIPDKRDRQQAGPFVVRVWTVSFSSIPDLLFGFPFQAAPAGGRAQDLRMRGLFRCHDVRIRRTHHFHRRIRLFRLY